MALVKEKTYHTRYFTYYLDFPGGDQWCAQCPFIHELQFELKKTIWWLKRGNIARDLLVKGEASWSDKNSVRHTVRIEDTQRPRVWGTKTKQLYMP